MMGLERLMRRPRTEVPLPVISSDRYNRAIVNLNRFVSERPPLIASPEALYEYAGWVGLSLQDVIHAKGMGNYVPEVLRKPTWALDRSEPGRSVLTWVRNGVLTVEEKHGSVKIYKVTFPAEPIADRKMTKRMKSEKKTPLTIRDSRRYFRGKLKIVDSSTLDMVQSYVPIAQNAVNGVLWIVNEQHGALFNEI